jgi:L-methionine (R)-S-oxide reductase
MSSLQYPLRLHRKPPRALYPTCWKGVTSRAIAGRRTINVGDVANDPDYLTALGSTRAEIIIPVLDRSGNRVIGTIDVESERPDAFNSVTQDLLEGCVRVIRGFWAGGD